MTHLARTQLSPYSGDNCVHVAAGSCAATPSASECAPSPAASATDRWPRSAISSSPAGRRPRTSTSGQLDPAVEAGPGRPRRSLPLVHLRWGKLHALQGAILLATLGIVWLGLEL